MEECTRAEIGVGAAIAAGSHAEKGNWALFEQAAKVKRIKIIKGKFSLKEKFQLHKEVMKAIDNRIKMSPTRLEKMVIEPEAEAEKFW